MTFAPRPDRDRWDSDPTYIRNRAIIKAQRRPCARCGGAIAYDEPYWVVSALTGRRTINRRAFHCGHKLSRINGGSHDLANLQPEHAGCSISAGAKLGRQRFNGHKIARIEPETVQVVPTTYDRW